MWTLLTIPATLLLLSALLVLSDRLDRYGHRRLIVSVTRTPVDPEQAEMLVAEEAQALLQGESLGR
jgi:hypothetical protein